MKSIRSPISVQLYQNESDVWFQVYNQPVWAGVQQRIKPSDLVAYHLRAEIWNQVNRDIK